VPSLSFFIDKQDLDLLVRRLNADPEIAFIVLDKSRESDHRSSRWWKAVRTVVVISDGSHSLWHVPAGPLLQVSIPTGIVPVIGLRPPPIPDPWEGWFGPAGFGSGCHPWIRLELWTRHCSYTHEERDSGQPLASFWLDDRDMLVVSDFQWTGNHFGPAPPQTQRWWKRMRGWIDRTAVRLEGTSGFWAFPSALQKLKNGMRYYARGFDLDQAIRTAKV